MTMVLNLSFLCALVCCTGFVKAGDNADSYSTEVEGLFKDLTTYTVNVNIAKQKMNTFAEENLDRKYAIAMINLYTQASSFYSTLNYQMRTNYPDTSTDIWRRAGKLINKGLDILGPKIHEKVYRGCSKLDTLPVVGQTYAFNQIISTSLNKGTAVGFIGCSNGKLFEIENVYGVSAEKYSAFEFEREIIVKSTNTFLVKSGPEPEAYYNIYHLDGQPGVNNVETNSAAPAIGPTTKYLVVIMLVLYMS